MAGQSWDFQSADARDQVRDRELASWLAREVRPFSAYWGRRLEGLTIERADELAQLAVTDEAEFARAGGPGNPDLLVLPTEAQFKRHSSFTELVAAGREVGGGGANARRAALFRRYKPVHVHEAGVAEQLAVAYSRSDLQRLHLAGARLVEVLGLGADDNLVNAVPAGPSVCFWGLYHAALAGRMTALHPRGGGEEPIEPVARALAMLPASVLAVPAAEAEQLLDGLAQAGVRAEELRTVLTVGPPPSATTRQVVAEAAERLGARGVRVQAVWAPEMSRSLWGECRPPTADPAEATYGLHTYPDLDLLEVRDVERNAGADAASPGELVLTTLGWRGTALVRAATGAWTGGMVDSVACPRCERTVPRLAPSVVEAAWQPQVAAGDEALAHADLRKAPEVLQPQALDRVGVRDWSLQAVDGALVLGLDMETDDTRPAANLARRVGNAVGVTPKVRIDPKAAAARPRLGAAGPPPDHQEGRGQAQEVQGGQAETSEAESNQVETSRR
jgi:hypothetical protein